MKAHYDTIDGQKYYLAFPFDIKTLKDLLIGYETIYAYDPVDHDIKSRYESIGITWLETPNFLTDEETIINFFKDKKRYLMVDFYTFQRKRLNILMNEDGIPIGDKYSFDTENREKLPKEITIPSPIEFSKSSYLKDAAEWTNRMFPNHPGHTDTFNHPITRQQALKQLKVFLDEKFLSFGPYQDALSDQDPLLFHSNLSSSLNIGLLSPREIIDEALKKDVPIASKEGFIRQIIGWREFIRAVYLLEGKNMRDHNVLNHKNKLSRAWVEGPTGIPIVDQTIKKLINNAYSHHIERLMVLGNILILINAHPDEVYRYFMTMHIDAYDWVMVPNLYGMSQFASGNLMVSKPYFSGSNYLLKMGVPKGPWEETWDALFYFFLKEHRAIIESNPRLRMLINHLKNKDDDTMKHYMKLKKEFLSIVTDQSKEV
jgi:deoxyribodipyrimidine photolyase-related protein